MQDTISKNTGNSRTLASVPNFLTIYPTYEAFGQALINRELPIDLGPLNLAGLLQKGTDLNKANLLTDETAALYGLGESATLDEIFVKIQALLNIALGKAKIETVSYVGTGTFGSGNPCSVEFSFEPKIVLFETSSTIDPIYKFILFPSKVPTSYTKDATFGKSVSVTGPNTYTITAYGKKSTDGKIISWYTTCNNSSYNSQAVTYQLNSSGDTYRFTAIG